MSHYLSMMIYLLILFLGGGTGFIGTQFINLLKSKNYNVTVISRMPGVQRISWVN